MPAGRAAGCPTEAEWEVVAAREVDREASGAGQTSPPTSSTPTSSTRPRCRRAGQPLRRRLAVDVQSPTVRIRDSRPSPGRWASTTASSW